MDNDDNTGTNRPLTTRDLFERYASAVACVSVEHPDGTQGVGSAFHVGDGVFVTARHVVENVKVLEIATTIDRDVPDPDGHGSIHGKDGFFTRIRASVGTVRAGPFFHPNPSVDVAALLVDGINAPVIPLGSHLDDWLNDDAFVLRKVLIMGYPPIPLSSRNVLVASHAEINAIVDQYIGPHPRFIVSSMARGGFSGGPCLIEWDFALGMVTSASVMNEGPVETGFMSVISVEPILECLGANRIMPRQLAELWDGLFTAESAYFGNPDKSIAVAWITTDRDGHRTLLRLACASSPALEEALTAIRDVAGTDNCAYQVRDVDVHEFIFTGNYDDLERVLSAAATVARQALERNGLSYVESPRYITRIVDGQDVRIKYPLRSERNGPPSIEFFGSSGTYPRR